MHVLHLTEGSDTRDEVFRVYETKEDAHREAARAQEQGWLVSVAEAPYFPNRLSDAEIAEAASKWFAD